MDFVKREDQHLIDEDSYKAYAESLQKQQQQMELEYQHTPISMEQLHQAMQSSLTAGTISNITHNLQIPLSPRQMSTLMLKTNQLSRNLHFTDIPSHLQRNLTSEIELAQNLANELNMSQSLRHEDMRIQNGIPRSLINEMDLQHNIGLAQNLVQSLSDHIDLSRNIGAENLRTDYQHVLRSDQNSLNHELDLSHHGVNRNTSIEQELLEDSRRTPTIVQCVPDTMLDQSIDQRLANHSLVDPNGRIDGEHLIPMPFHIKAEQEDDGYFYDQINQGFGHNINGLPGHMPMNTESTHSNTNVHQDNQLYNYNTHIANINTPSPIDVYSRQPTFVQNYSINSINRDNPQNLVVNRQFENHSPYPLEEYKRKREDGAGVVENGAKSDSSKLEQPKENLKPTENKIFYAECSQNASGYGDKSENDQAEQKMQNSKEDPLKEVIKGEYVCYKCSDVFPTKRGLKQHTKSCSENGENTDTTEKTGKFSCTLCSYRCQSPAILRIHERTHTGEKPFSCTFCDYKSGQKNNVAKHILVHMKEKPFSCQYCEYRCAQKNNLVVHERTHTGYKPFACPYCDYRTVQKPNLVKHMYLHTDKKPFSCDICSYRCVQKTNLTKHKQRHLNEKDGERVDFKNIAKVYRPRQKSVKCPHCPYKCVQKSSLDKHMQFKHADTNQSANAEFSEQSFENGLNLMKNDEVNETIQNLSVKKVSYISEVMSDGKLIEPSHAQS